MTEEQGLNFFAACYDYRKAHLNHAHSEYIKLRDYVETLIDEAVKDAISAHKADKE